MPTNFSLPRNSDCRCGLRFRIDSHDAPVMVRVQISRPRNLLWRCAVPQCSAAKGHFPSAVLALPDSDSCAVLTPTSAAIPQRRPRGGVGSPPPSSTPPNSHSGYRSSPVPEPLQPTAFLAIFHCALNHVALEGQCFTLTSRQRPSCCHTIQ